MSLPEQSVQSHFPQVYLGWTWRPLSSTGETVPQHCRSCNHDNESVRDWACPDSHYNDVYFISLSYIYTLLSDLRIYEDQHVFGGAGALSVPGTATHILVSDPYSPGLSHIHNLFFFSMNWNSITCHTIQIPLAFIVLG